MDIEISRKDAVLQVAINRPAKRNALTTGMYRTLADALDEASSDPLVNVILLCGAQGIFSAGNDLDDLRTALERDDWSAGMRLYRTLCCAEKPVVASVEGMAIGAAATLLLHCDLVYAADDAVFAFPCAQFGLTPEAGATLLLPRLAGYQRAAEKLLVGEPFDALEAARIGMVTRVAPSAEVGGLALAQAQKLARLPTPGVRTIKALMRTGVRDAALERMDEELLAFRSLIKRTLIKPDCMLSQRRRVPRSPAPDFRFPQKLSLLKDARIRRSRLRGKN